MVKTDTLVIGRNKLKVGNLVRIETHNSFKSGSLLRTVVGKVESIEEQDYKLTIVLSDALDDYTWSSREKVKQKVKFEWTVGYNHAYYYLDKDSDLVMYIYKYIIKNATPASLKLLANKIKKEHLKNIKDWNKEIKSLQKEIDAYKESINKASKCVTDFEQEYGV